jgi:hypothetical protein
MTNVDHPTKPFQPKVSLLVKFTEGGASFQELPLSNFISAGDSRMNMALLTPPEGSTVLVKLLQGPIDHHGDDGIEVTEPSIVITEPSRLGLDEMDIKVVPATMLKPEQLALLPELLPNPDTARSIRARLASRLDNE